MKLVGVVKSGLGEGRKYLKLYAEYFKERFGHDFYPGTLNVKVTAPIAKRKYALVIIPKEEGLYPVICYEIELNGLPVILVIPQVTEHPDTLLEIISSHNLREKLELKDGDAVDLTF